MHGQADLAGKVALVTGGERGIGSGITKNFLERGMAVLVAGLDAKAGARLLELDWAKHASERLAFWPTDVGDEAQVSSAIAEAVNRFDRLDGLICNAGLGDPEFASPENLDLAVWETVLRTNLTGSFLCAKHAIPHLRAQRGAIVMIASTRALQSEPRGEPYAASKGGILALTHALALSCGPDVRVNAISPGWIEHSDRPSPRVAEQDHMQHPVGRVGYPEDVSHLAAFLVSEESRFLTGENIVCDGGMTRKMIYV